MTLPTHPPHTILCIVPPHMLREIEQRGTDRQKEWARRTLAASDDVRRERVERVASPQLVSRVAATGKERVVYDAGEGTALPGAEVRREGEGATGDPAVDEAFEGSGHTYDLFLDIYARSSIDGAGMRLDSTVHYRQGFDNAFWNGQQMVYGDGDEDLPPNERLFNRFTASLDVIGHELTHGVVQFTAGLVYQDQSGALNESFADVFGSLVKQRHLNQTADQADWLIGAELLSSNVQGTALRSLKAPGTAYDDPALGRDPQPAHMDHYVDTTADHGGVHINSGIPNHAFYLVATAIGGSAWEKAGRIWYGALTDPSLGALATFQEMADLTHGVAGHLYGPGSAEQQAVASGWQGVGITVTPADGGNGDGDTGDTGDGGQNTGCLPALFGLRLWRS